MPTTYDTEFHTLFAIALASSPRMIKLGVPAALDQRIAVRHQTNGMTDP